MRKFLVFSLILCLLLSVFAACTTPETDNGGSSESSVESSSESKQPGGDEIESTSETQKKDETDKKEESSESESESESETENVIVDVTPALPEEKEDLYYITADGYVLNHYNNKTMVDYLAACAYFEEDGYELYSDNVIGTAYSSTYVKGSAYCVVMINQLKNELYIGKCDSGAENLPGDTSDYLDMNDTTVTQFGTEELNGMGYAIRLADGSFILFDGGYHADAASAFETLVRLNDGSEHGIHIRAWFITHSHGDHYQMFEQFSKDFGDKVTLDSLYYCAIQGEYDGDVAQDAYLTNRAPVDLRNFDGAKSFQVHTGMTFDIANVNISVLCSPDQVYKTERTNYFNESSVVLRVSDGKGSIIITGDIGEMGCTFMMECYGEGLQSNLVQMSHHGVENAPGVFYDYVKPSTVFIPYKSSLEGGGRAKQYVFQSDYVNEVLCHGYGDVTRLLSHVAEAPETISVLPPTAGAVNGTRIENIEITEDGALTYTVSDAVTNPESGTVDAYFYYALNKKYGIDPSYHNVLKIVVNGKPFFDNDGNQLYGRGGELYYSSTTGWSAERIVTFYNQGHSVNDTLTYYVYLGDVEDYVNGDVKYFRFDIGSIPGEEIVIYSMEMLHVDIDQIEAE